MQPKNMSITQQQSSKRGVVAQTHISNQAGAGGTVHVQSQGLTINSNKITKKKAINSQQMTFVSDQPQVKTVMVPSSNHDNQRVDFFNQQNQLNSQFGGSKT